MKFVSNCQNLWVFCLRRTSYTLYILSYLSFLRLKCPCLGFKFSFISNTIIFNFTTESNYNRFVPLNLGLILNHNFNLLT